MFSSNEHGRSVTLAPTPKQIKDLRHQLASAISDAKAYDLPSICSRLGLFEGETDEAMRSKYKYASIRISDVPAGDLPGIARTYLAEDDHFELSEALAKIDEAAGPTITDLTRKRLIDIYGEFPICTEQQLIDFLKALWPISTMLEADQIPGISRTVEEAIFQHTVRNYDWDNKDVLKAVGLPSMSQRQFFRFLAASVHPMAQNDERQAVMVVLRLWPRAVQSAELGARPGPDCGPLRGPGGDQLDLAAAVPLWPVGGAVARSDVRAHELGRSESRGAGWEGLSLPGGGWDLAASSERRID